MTDFGVWAPAAGRVDVEVDGVGHAMRCGGRPGWWTATVPDAGHGADYAFRLDGGPPLPDPRSPRQPDGIHGPSRVYSHGRFDWTDAGWRGVPLPGSVLYELHVGTFTPDGTFDGAIERLDHLVELGVDAVELLPVVPMPGEHGWGYEGVDLFAVHEPYGGPDGLKRFVDACHGRGLAVVLDVVYNHLGPDGDHLPAFGPYFTDGCVTPWGDAVNLDGPGSDEVRAFFVDNARHWLRDYHVDGLRLDAVHALRDHSAVHLLAEIALAVRDLAAQLGRALYVIAESDLNDPRLVTAPEAGGYGLDAQWSDDFHHALHAALTGDRQGYYCDFGPLSVLATTLTRVFFHDGRYSTFRGRRHGRPVDRRCLPAFRFLGYLQDHDQVGNRATGDRISAQLSPALLKVAVGLVLTAPFTPMLFMGEEWGASTPWRFFTDHTDPELARAVSRGRRAEFAAHGWDAARVPDPQAPETFGASKLDWAERLRAPYAGVLRWYTELIALRRARPELTDPRLTEVHVDYDERTRWFAVHRGGLRIVANLHTQPVAVPLGHPGGRILLSSAPGTHLTDASAALPGESLAIVDCG